MAGKEIPPQLGADSYSCPHCGALAHQFWFHVVPSGVAKGSKPTVFTLTDVKQFAALPREDDDEGQKNANALLARFRKHEVTHEVKKYSSNPHWEMMNAFISRCYACEGFSFWIKDQLVWPAHSLKIEPHADIPANVKDDFIEASEIVQKSPRGSAALSRLIVQKLMADLG